MVFGIKVSKSGNDVSTAATKDLILDSTVNQLKVKEVLSADKTKTGSGTETFTLAHSLGYIPGYLPFLKVSSRWYGAVGEDPTSGLTWVTKVDASNVSFVVSGGAGESIKLKAFVLVDEGTSTVASTSTTDAFGIKVSVTDKDVNTADDQDLSLSTLFETLQIIEVKSINNTSSLGEVTSAHALSYTPAWIAMVIDNNDNFKTFLVPYLVVGQREMMVWSDTSDIGTRNESAGSEDLTYKIAVLTAKLE